MTLFSRPNCTCEPAPRGPPWDDGSDPGMCPACEAAAEGWDDETVCDLINDFDPNEAT